MATIAYTMVVKNIPFATLSFSLLKKKVSAAPFKIRETLIIADNTDFSCPNKTKNALTGIKLNFH